MNSVVIEDKRIENMIYEIRGKQVMLDSDLAKLYKCKNGTKVINQAVSRNIERFPDDFYFQLTSLEYKNLKSQFVTSSLENNYGGVRKLPYVFTEQGVAMLSSVLRTEVASSVSINIMRAFVAMRHYIGNNEYRLSNVETKVIEHDKEIKLLQETLDKFDSVKKVNEIYFKGQIYDAYSKIIDIFKTAKKELIIIDSYADKTVLDMIRNINVNIILITKKNNKLTNTDINKYNKQYNNLNIIYNDTFHDRYFIIDKNTIYHCGASINHAGRRTFSINILDDEIVKDNLINSIKQIIN